MAGKEPEWLTLTRNLQAIAQNGLTFTDGLFDRERYEELRIIASRLMAIGSDGDLESIVDLFSREDGYTTPKVDVRGVVLREDRVLLVEERSDGCWSARWLGRPRFDPERVRGEGNSRRGWTQCPGGPVACGSRPRKA